MKRFLSWALSLVFVGVCSLTLCGSPSYALTRKEVTLPFKYFPAFDFVTEAKRFKSDITLIVEGKEFDAKSTFKLGFLNLTKGSVFTITANGEDEQQAIEHLISYKFKGK